jgi:hypothetical protein
MEEYSEQPIVVITDRRSGAEFGQQCWYAVVDEGDKPDPEASLGVS